MNEKKSRKLRTYSLPNYSNGEEIMNMVTHITGGAFGILALVLCLYRTIIDGNALDITGVIIYSCSIIALYAVSSVYHGLHPSFGKKVMQIIDHCMIYFLIAGTYTPIMLTAFVPVNPLLGWGLLIAEWGLAALAITLTAIDLHRYRVFSMICYIGMGWGIIFFLPYTLRILTASCFLLLLSGGIAYTIGAILYGIGAKKQWIHSVFHIFVVLGSILQFLAIFLYIL